MEADDPFFGRINLVQGDPFFGGQIQHIKPDTPADRTRRLIVKAGLLGGATLLTGGVAKLFIEAKNAEGKKVTPTRSDILASPKKPGGGEIPPSPTIAVPTATKEATAAPTAAPMAQPSPTETPQPEPQPKLKPELEPEEIAEKEVGDQNLAEYFLADFIKLFKEERQRRLNEDPGYAERIFPELLNSDNINFLFLGIDETRERPENGVWSGKGWGRSDVVMLVSFDPHTFKTTAVSLPRDLYAPELTKYRFSGGARINGVTMTPVVDRNADSFEIARKIIETATGVPVDGVVQANIDAMQGVHYNPKFEDQTGLFDVIFPNGLEINVVKELVDELYPLGYGFLKPPLHFKPGRQTMNGTDLTRYGRSRHQDSDFGRSERQRQILKAGIKDLLPRMLGDFVKGETITFNLIINSLLDQEQETNFFYDTNIIAIIENIKQNVAQLRNPVGLAILSLLAGNSRDQIRAVAQEDEGTFVSLGVARENGIVSNPVPGDTMLVLNGSSVNTAATPLGNFLNYWEPIRRKVANLL